MSIETRGHTSCGKLTLRSVVLSLVLMPFLSYWLVQVEYVYCTLHPTLISLFATSVFTLTLLTALNLVLHRWWPHRAFSQYELLVVYAMLNISSVMVSHHMLQVLISSLPYPAHFANSVNRWASLFGDRLPTWLTVQDNTALDAFYRGGNLYDPAVYGPWLLPLAVWGLFILVLFGMFLCINVLFRNQWSEKEKLSYPLIILPVELTQPGAPLFANRLFWLGFIIAASIDIVNGLHQYLPALPEIPIKNHLHGLTDSWTRPWNALGWVPITVYPFAIGLGMLLPLDVLFSCWFFFWVWKMQFVAAAALGWDTIPNVPFVNQQSLGAYIGIGVFAIAASRRHLMAVLRHCRSPQSDIDDADEPISYRLAVLLLVCGSLALCVFAWLIGMSLWVTLAFFGLYFTISIAITRMRAEMGMPAHDLQGAGPDAIIPGMAGSRTLGLDNSLGLTLMQWFNRGYQSHAMPFQLESLRMTQDSASQRRGMFVALWIAAIAGMLVGVWALLHTIYGLGGATSRFAPPVCALHLGSEPWNRMGVWASAPSEPSLKQSIAVGAGFLVTIALQALRMQFTGFPLHPVGYAVSGSWSMHILWAPLLVAWIIKLPLLHFGGLKTYRKVAPFFLGLIVAECVIGSGWTLISAIFGIPAYRFFP